MIYSKKTSQYVPTTVEKQIFSTGDSGHGNITRYSIKDRKVIVGRVDLRDRARGIDVLFIQNNFPDLYGNIGKTADQIEVEHCLRRGLKNFDISSDAYLNSHALHYIRGKRFINPENNEIVRKIIENTPKGEMFHTEFLGKIGMYMPLELIKKYIEIIQKSPLLKNIK